LKPRKADDGKLDPVTAGEGLKFDWCPPGARVLCLLPVPGTQDVILLIEADRNVLGDQQTLFRCRGDGSMAWAAELPSGGGAYVSAALTESEVKANTWDAHFVVLDLEHGRIQSVEFVK
jgi:hypothetical protein